MKTNKINIFKHERRKGKYSKIILKEKSTKKKKPNKD
jgi:hypothetical protein